MGHTKVAAIRVDRRAIVVAVFADTHLDYVQVRQLSGDPEKAESSVTGFVNWIVSAFAIDSAAIEQFEGDDEVRREHLTRTVMAALRVAGVPIWKVSRDELMASFGEPPPGNRRILREVIARIWPVLNTRGQNPLILDAAAVGLYVQTERLFLEP